MSALAWNVIGIAVGVVLVVVCDIASRVTAYWLKSPRWLEALYMFGYCVALFAALYKWIAR